MWGAWGPRRLWPSPTRCSTCGFWSVILQTPCHQSQVSTRFEPFRFVHSALVHPVVDRHPAKATHLDVKARLRAMISDDQRWSAMISDAMVKESQKHKDLPHLRIHWFIINSYFCWIDQKISKTSVQTKRNWPKSHESRYGTIGRYWDFHFFTAQLGLELPRPGLFASSSPTSIFESPTRNIYDIITIIMPSPLNHDPSHSKQSANLQESSMVVCGLVESSEFSLHAKLGNFASHNIFNIWIKKMWSNHVKPIRWSSALVIARYDLAVSDYPISVPWVP